MSAASPTPAESSDRSRDRSDEELVRLGPTAYAQRKSELAEASHVAIDLTNQQFRMSGCWGRCRVAEHHIESHGASKSPICWELEGYLSGFVSEVLGESILFIEDECIACEAPACHFSGRRTADWGAEAAPYLPYYERLRLGDECASARLQLEELKQRLDCGCSFEDLVVESPAMLETVRLACKVAPTDATVLLTGESGTGKELLARSIHNNSPRSRGPFIGVNCAALPEPLLEDELFGHERGAFTGADRRRAGRFELAEGGTLFLDEIGEIAPAVQVKLLRALQEREFERLGGTRTLTADVRVIAATNRNLSAEMEAGRFRDDLYYRLNVFHIHLSPLRERREEIPALAKVILENVAKDLGRGDLALSQAALEALQRHEWKGNVRELQNALERAAILCDGDLIRPEHLPIPHPATRRAELAENEVVARLGPGFKLKRFESELVERALHIARGNQSEAARLLGLSRGALRARLAKMAS